jgi:hypothetical protein
MPVEPVADVPAARHDAVPRRGLDVVHREFHEVGGVAVAAVRRLRVRAGEGDQIAVDDVVDDARQLSVDAQRVATIIRLVREFVGHGFSVPIEVSP